MLELARIHLKMALIWVRERFEPSFYRTYYPDMEGRSALALARHYAEYGRAEGRLPNAAQAIAACANRSEPLPPDFDPKAYRAFNADVAAVCVYDWQLALHYMDYGRRQSRAFRDGPTQIGETTTVYALRTDGLGTRLLTIIFAKIMADRCGLAFRVLWPPLMAPFYDDARLLDPRDLSDLFASDCVFPGEDDNRGDFAPNGHISANRYMRLVVRDPGLAWDETRLALLAQTYDGLTVEEPFAFEAMEPDPAALHARVKRLWNAIGWSDAIADFARAFHVAYPPGGYVAAHIRRGDIVAMLREADLAYLEDGGMTLILQRYAAISDFRAELERVGGDLPIVICSDDPDVQRDFAASGVAARFSRDLFAGTTSQRAAVDILVCRARNMWWRRSSASSRNARRRSATASASRCHRRPRRRSPNWRPSWTAAMRTGAARSWR